MTEEEKKKLYVEAIVKEHHIITFRVDVTGVEPHLIDNLLKSYPEFPDPIDGQSASSEISNKWEEVDHVIDEHTDTTIDLNLIIDKKYKNSLYEE